jgi:hypothetical protein
MRLGRRAVKAALLCCALIPIGCGIATLVVSGFPNPISSASARAAELVTDVAAETSIAELSLRKLEAPPPAPSPMHAPAMVVSEEVNSAERSNEVQSSSQAPPEETEAPTATVNTDDVVHGDFNGTTSAIAKPPDSAPDDKKAAEECFLRDVCIDEYLWSLYQRAPKQDTVKVVERKSVTKKVDGKARTVAKESSRLVDEDFTWKDPKAAEKAGMPLMDYVIGGMDQDFRRKLYRALRAMDDAGLYPGITSAFRDDYRQSLASGLKAATDRSYHGGSSRGGYGHGLAADLVSVKGETRAERLTSSQTLWQWIDAHGGEFGIGRPYLDKDPPHVAPVDGKEYADHRRTKPPSVRAYLAKHNLLPAWADHGAGARLARRPNIEPHAPFSR